MPKDVMVRQCAPTLAGIKTGSLFPYRYASESLFIADVRDFNKSFAPKGLRLIPLRYGNGNALLYLYRPERLKNDLHDAVADEVLSREGYDSDSASGCIVRLMKKLRQDTEFPHEIGLFLSYPPEDVKGFIENHAANYKLSGLWKVYGDEEKAKKTFEKFKSCTRDYLKRAEAGAELEELTV